MAFNELKKAVKLLTLPVLIFIAGCAVGPDFKEPVVETPQQYRFEAEPEDAVINLKWWELFEDPVLYTLVTKALENNRDVRIAISRIIQAQAALGFTSADRYPKLDLDGGARRGNFAGGSLSPNTDHTAYLSANLSWEIDFWGKFRRATESARAELLASEYALRTVQLSLISQVVSTYYLLLDFHQRLTTSENTLKSRLESLDIIQKRFDKGIIPELDVNQAQIEKEIAAEAIPVFERSIAKTEHAMSILLGELPTAIRMGKPLKSQAVPPVIPTGLPSNILKRRPDIAEAMYLLKAQTENIGVAEALRFPAITLTGVLGAASTEVSSITTDGDAWFVGGSLLGPIYNFNKNIRRVEIEEARTQQALFRYENTVLVAFREVEDALVEIQTYKKQIDSVEKRRKAAANASKLSALRYDKGVTSYLEVLDTQRSLFDAELQQSEVKQLYLNAYVTLYKALGGGWITKEEMWEDCELCYF
jgi:multidrug efflux system outer membrane protein